MVWGCGRQSLLLFVSLVAMRHCFDLHGMFPRLVYNHGYNTRSLGSCTRRYSATTIGIGSTSISMTSKSNEVAASVKDDAGLPSTSLNPLVQYKRGQLIEVKVVSFGPMGASIVLTGDSDRRGLILQKELAMFRDRRDRQEVTLGEVLGAYVERVRETGNIDVSLRPVDVARIELVKTEIMDALGDE